MRGKNKILGKGVLAIAGIFAIVAILAIAGNGNAQGNIYVDPSDPNAYHSIQAAIDAASDGDTIIVNASTYTESITINKSINLIGEPGAIIKCPATPENMKIQESSHTYEYVIGVFGGTYGSSNNTYYGSGTVNVNISGFTIDSNDTTPSDRFAGIFFRNMIGNISDCTIINTNVDGKETFGILGYGNSDITIYGNTVDQFGRGGIGVNGDGGSLPDPTCLIKNNVVIGPGKNPVVTWAPNGIQVGYNASGIVTGNDVSACGWNGTEWSGTGIIVVDTNVSSVIVDNNYVHNCESGITFVAYWDYCSNAIITNNTVEDTDWSIALHNDVRGATIMYNTIVNCTGDCIDVYCYKIFGDSGYPYDTPPTNVEIHYNNLLDATYDGLWVGPYVTDVVNATYNYWGHATGPYNEIENPYGQGVSVVGNATFIPWLDSLYPDNDYGNTKESPVQNSYYNDSFAPKTNAVIDAKNEADVVVIINSSSPNSITILNYTGNPEEELPSDVIALGKYIDIIVENESNITWPVEIRLFYTQNDLDTAGLTEEQLVGMLYW
ncbi:MAG: right-handed parallel beta-helix repeat-containing protein, partial [Thermoplasmata archaeon]|nr:right-handed parallel beta-helix repeat-containing protein [Thermoplasmata archaeon]